MRADVRRHRLVSLVGATCRRRRAPPSPRLQPYTEPIEVAKTYVVEEGPQLLRHRRRATAPSAHYFA
jgi:hypothetical protein